MMRTPAYLCLLLTCMLISCTPTQEKHEIDYTSYVNPFIGTDFTGNTYPGAQAPFGMVQLSPDNGLPGWDRISGYFYPDSTIAGFTLQQALLRTVLSKITARVCRPGLFVGSRATHCSGCGARTAGSPDSVRASCVAKRPPGIIQATSSRAPRVRREVP